jgi:hypothetical protein
MDHNRWKTGAENIHIRFAVPPGTDYDSGDMNRLKTILLESLKANLRRLPKREYELARVLFYDPGSPYKPDERTSS